MLSNNMSIPNLSIPEYDTYFYGPNLNPVSRHEAFVDKVKL